LFPTQRETAKTTKLGVFFFAGREKPSESCRRREKKTSQQQRATKRCKTQNRRTIDIQHSKTQNRHAKTTLFRRVFFFFFYRLSHLSTTTKQRHIRNEGCEEKETKERKKRNKQSKARKKTRFFFFGFFFHRNIVSRAPSPFNTVPQLTEREKEGEKNNSLH
jgi:hypothetical protein